MATTQITLGFFAGATQFHETAVGATALGVKASSGTLYMVVVDNTANTAASYVKIYNLASGSVTVGTTAPDKILFLPASVKKTWINVEGTVLATAISVACVTTGGTAGTTAPTGSVVLDIVYV